MREIIHNYDNLEESEINRIVKRAKILLLNDQNEVIICNSKHNYFLLVGHVEDNESDLDCLNRELLEEAGVKLNLIDMKLFMSIKYFNKDYPNIGTNTESIANYYYLQANVEPKLEYINLTEEEKQGNFKIEKIHIDEIEDILINSLELATRRVVVEDTIEVLKEFRRMSI